MKAKYLDPKNGLSMTDAQSISNMCNQKVSEIEASIKKSNNFSSKFTHNNETVTFSEPKPLPTNVVELIKEAGEITGLQAYLMEAIKEKNVILDCIRFRDFKFDLDKPLRAIYEEYKDIKPQVNEDWGFNQLSEKERVEYLTAEAMASKIGKGYIHSDGYISKLRKGLENTSLVDFIELKQGERTPVIFTPHHSSEQLFNIHTELERVHRDNEKRVNYYKAKVKNMISEENVKINSENAIEIARVDAINEKIDNDYQVARSKYNAEKAQALKAFESEREKDLKKASALKIKVPESLQNILNNFIVVG